MGATTIWPPPPPSIASNTMSASPRDPTSAGRWPGPHTQDTRPGTTLGNKVNPRSTSMVYYASPFLRRMYHTPAHGIPCEQGNNDIHDNGNVQVDDEQAVWAVFSPTFLYFVVMCVVACAMAILSCCCLVISVVHHPGWGGVHYCFTS